ncbi:MAG TPA: serine/threonine-protein kinase [Kofleriaceae bacterium]|nr:serine/threonine-protein kinase [Kofleriaceae bacterium]
MGSADELALRIAVAEGLVSGAEARALGDEAARAGQGVLERLHSEGRISGATFASLRARVDEEAEELNEVPTGRQRPGAAPADDSAADSAADRTRPGFREQPTVRQIGHDDTWNYHPARGGSATGATGVAGVAGTTGTTDTDGASGNEGPDAFPVPGWDRFEPIRLLGKGGMGRVFLAKDLRLGRNVAIKFVRGDDPEYARRIVAEARAQARVNDERVCKVYEVGEVRGRVYIAMQHIDGRPLSDLARELTVEQKALVMRGAALGIAEAHRVGLIHRDVKPSNIMVERDVDGALRPFVMDFGLARDWTEGTTMTGTVLGTPQFMSPEQARGEVARLDRRADVYSLGATLYAMLTEQPPIAGTNPLEILSRVPSYEPQRPRAIDRDVPSDLEAIVMKCLEKERAARYDSARALADDLGRFLAGEPVAARASAGLGYRLRKALRRHARLVAGVAVALIAVAIALGFAVRERWLAARREELARRFTERVERIESMARYAALAPAHDLRPDRARIRGAMDELFAEVRAAGDLAAGPGHYALGRGHLALDDDARAADELAAAWQRGFRAPRVAYALALARGRLYQRALREVERSDLSAERRAARRREVEQQLREPVLAALRESEGPEVPSAHVAALIAFYEGSFDAALAQLDALERAGDTRAWFYEAPLLRGEVLHARAESRTDPAAAAADLEAARGVLDAAAAVGESVPAVHRARAELELTALWREIYGGGAVDAPFSRGVAAAERVLMLLPDDAGALALRARLRRGLAEHRDRRGEDVTQLLTEAVADARRALALDPTSRAARLALVDIYKQWGEANQGRGRDPGEQLGQAVAILDAIPEAERDADFYLRLGLIHAVWANYQDRVGQDSSTHRRQAIGAYEQAVRSDDRLGMAWLNLGDSYRRRASRPGAQDPDRDLAAARDALARGRALDRTNYLTYLYEGDVRSQLAHREQERGGDPARERAQAIALYQQGAAVSPGNSYFPIAISVEHVEEAKETRRRGGDPLPALALAEAAARRAVEIAPDQGYGYTNLGAALLERAEYQAAHSVDPLPAARAAEVAFQQALERLPDLPMNRQNLVDLHLFFATVELDRGGDPKAHLGHAEEALDHAPNLSDAEARARRERLRALRERWLARGRGSAARDPAR